MTAIDIALPRLQTEEGFRALPYNDTNGFETIGYGFNVQGGISRAAAAALLDAQAREAHAELLKLPWYAALDPVRQSVCLDIDINEGERGLLKFPHMIAALSRQDWASASAECHVEDPKLAGRYSALAKILLTGEA
jgi:GH24 family phage-related lysozyme (muramidase)